MHEMTVFVPDAEPDPEPPALDPTFALSTSETLAFYLDAPEGVHAQRRNSVGEPIGPKRSIHCEVLNHDFIKIGNDIENGLWPAGKYKCQHCNFIVGP